MARVGVPRSSEIRTGRSREIVVVVVVVVVAVVAKVASFLAENESTTIGHSKKEKKRTRNRNASKDSRHSVDALGGGLEQQQ